MIKLKNWNSEWTKVLNIFLHDICLPNVRYKHHRTTYCYWCTPCTQSTKGKIITYFLFSPCAYYHDTIIQEQKRSEWKNSSHLQALLKLWNNNNHWIEVHVGLCWQFNWYNPWYNWLNRNYIQWWQFLLLCNFSKFSKDCRLREEYLLIGVSGQKLALLTKPSSVRIDGFLRKRQSWIKYKNSWMFLWRWPLIMQTLSCPDKTDNWEG